MHQECCKRKKASLIEVIVIVLILYVLILGINILVYHSNVQKIYGDLLTIFIPIFIIAYVLRSHRLVYKYSIICEEFIIKQLVGHKEKILVDININQIEKISKGSLSRQEKKAFTSAKKYVNNVGWKSGTYYCIYKVNENKHYFEFEPSDKLLEKLIRNN